MTRRESYLGLDPGLGKTAVAAAVAKFAQKRVIYICPPFLFANVLAEFERWGAGDLIYLFPDSTIDRKEDRALVFHLIKGGWSTTLIVDEAHRFKDFKARRTRSVLGYDHVNKKTGKEVVVRGLIEAPKLTRIVFMSGTPMPNRPLELWPVLSTLAPWTIRNMKFFSFAMRYCGAHKSKFGWDFSGSSNMAELGQRVKTDTPQGPAFMLRMRKKDVLKDLPPKIEELFVLTGTMSQELRKLDEGLTERYSKAGDEMARELDAPHVATYQRMLGEAKVPYAAEYIESILTDTAENVLIFAKHTAVIAALEKALAHYQPLVITGDTPIGERKPLVDQFQAGKTRVLIGNYIACGVGFDLSRADRVVMVEFSWAPGENDQATDRPHRLSRVSPIPLTVQYLVFPRSLDQKIIESTLEKRASMQHV